MTKTCFVIMGFGVKTDPGTGQAYDLDKTYKHIIKPCVEACGYRCVRADEIKDSGLIDRSMYVLLMRSDLVIADISTYNPNAIYELGIRHAVKPYSTIIMKEGPAKIPFDFSHNRVFEYSHLGTDIGADEVARCSRELVSLINAVTDNPSTDSPLYTYLRTVSVPTIEDAEYEEVISDLAANENSLFALTELAKEKMKNSQFSDAAKLWATALNLVGDEPYFVQQQALCTYKSKRPSVLMALTNAFSIIEPLLDNGRSNDPETLGICGAINKRIWIETEDVEYLKKAISFYEKGYAVNGDYYTGENYAECLDLLSAVELDSDEKLYCRIRAKKIRESIVQSLEELATHVTADPECKWKYASLSSCYLRLNKQKESNDLKNLFLACQPQSWEIETFTETQKRTI